MEYCFGLTHEGVCWININSRWLEPLSLSSIFLLDDPTQLISLNPKAYWLNSQVMQRASGYASTSLPEWKNQIENVNIKPTIHIHKALTCSASKTLDELNHLKTHLLVSRFLFKKKEKRSLLHSAHQLVFYFTHNCI